MTIPRAVDLFAGCGGLTLGLKRAGFQVVGAVEIDDLASEAFAMNHPEVAFFTMDIRRLPVARLKRRLGVRKRELDLLAGCPPCQGFSTMRSLNGKTRVTDERNDLVFEFVRFVKGLLPKVVMLENVPGLANDRRWPKFITAIEDLGYVVNWGILDAADFHVPQRRRRLILVASRFGFVDFARESLLPANVRGAIGALPRPRASRDLLHCFPERRSVRVAEIIRSVRRNGGGRSDLPKRLRLTCHERTDGFKDVYGRMRWDHVAPTITSGCVNPSKGRFLHPSQDRCITLREAAMLQTFPRSYRFPLRRGKFAVAGLIGNALPPEFIRRHGSAIRRFLEEVTEPRLNRARGTRVGGN